MKFLMAAILAAFLFRAACLLASILAAMAGDSSGVTATGMALVSGLAAGGARETSQSARFPFE